MRLRNVKNAFDRIDQFDAVVDEPIQYKGKWHEFFGNDHPIHIEIGMGKGQFLIEHAKANPEINYLGFEKYTVVLVKALERIEQEASDLTNLKVLRFDAQGLLDIFDDNEVDRIYLNFSDPWPKERHYKRRLTYREFLYKYRQVMKEKGRLIFKTDNDRLFDFSIKEMKEVGMSFDRFTRDLHTSKWVMDNVMTEYETKFHLEGITINMVDATFI